MTEQKKYKLGLSMILKNESHVIERLLNSVASQIDFWCIVDTGSDDGTQEIIKDFFNKHNIPGQLIQDTWDDNFSRARNISLEVIEENCEYGFFIDADEELIAPEYFDIKKYLDGKIITYAIPTIYGQTNYVRKNIWKTNEWYKWRGPIHEILESPNETPENIGVLGDLKCIVRPEGNSWTGSITEKYKKYAEILSEYAKEDLDPRWIFYVAQNYRDANMFNEAAEWYLKRSQINEGNQEEIYYSKLMLGRLSEALGMSFETSLTLYNNALEQDPIRGETIKSISLMCQIHKRWEIQYLYSNYGLRYFKNFPNNQRNLFIEMDYYGYEALEWYAYAALATGRIQEGSMAYWALRTNIDIESIDSNSKNRLLENEKHFPKPPEQPKEITKPRGSNYTKPKKKRKR